MRYVLRGLLFITAIVVFLLLAAWLLLSSSILAGPRKAVVENVLAKELDQNVVINGDIRIGFGRALNVSAEGLALPSRSLPDVTLAEIQTLNFDVSAEELWKGKLRLSSFIVDGAQVNLITNEEGVTSWASDTENEAEAATKSKPVSAPGILQDRRLDLQNATVVYQSAQNGLDLNLQFTDLLLERGTELAAASAKGSGSLNDQKFQLDGSISKDEPISVSMDFDHISLSATQVDAASRFEMSLSADIAELGQLLDVLKLNRVLEGTGTVGGTLKIADGVARIDDLSVLTELTTGQSLELTGQLGELGNPADVSLTTRIRLYPEGSEPAPAYSRYDLKLISVDMVMDSVPGKVPQRSMVIETNGFTLDTAGEGPPPVKFSELSRTQDGALRVGNVNLRIGPPSEPFIILNGTVEDALKLEGVSAEGLLEIPTSSLISPDLLGPDDQLGEFTGNFHLNGDINQLSLSNLDGSTSGTEVWNLEVHGTVENVLKFENLDLGIDVDVPSGADLLQAMSLAPVETGPAKLSIQLASQGTDWTADATVVVADSSLNLAVDLDDATTDPVLRGTIESDLIKVEQLRSIIAVAAELRNLDTSDEEAAADDATADGTDADEGADAPNALRDVTLRPIGRSILLSGMNMDVDIDLRKIEGANGISTLQTELILDEEELRAGPLEFEYGGASFDVNGVLDLSNDAHLLTLSGQAGGWQLADILHNLKFKKGASGTIYADFNVTGGTESVRNFVGSMNGNATVSMRNGSIETQLLDLAGLGLLPWVFSKDKQKVAPIVCLRAPLSLSNGTISTKQTTMETDQVQVVVFGDVNLNKKAMDLNLQPRKIGEPLSRSPWPVTASGPLAKPKIKVKDGPKRLKRSDGADQMPAQRKLCVPDILQLQ
ncbi:MAG: AsmA family protein [Ruegeria sp.]